MKHQFTILCLFTTLFTLSVSAQNAKKNVEANFNEKESISHFRYLASDEMMGRDPIRPEINLATRYIAEQFWKYGAKEISGAKGFYQEIPFRISGPPSKGTLSWGNKTFSQGEDLLVLDGPSFAGNFELVVVGYGLEDDYKGKDVRGKVVVTNVRL